MAIVTFLVHPEHESAWELAQTCDEWLIERGHRGRLIRFAGHNCVDEAGVRIDIRDLDVGGSIVAVSLGGDGTFLRLVPAAWNASVPIVGVNFGRLGYLPELRPDELLFALESVLGGAMRCEKRYIIEVEIDIPSLVDGGDDGSCDAVDELALEGSNASGSSGSAVRSGLANGTASQVVPNIRCLALNEMVVERTVFGHTIRLATTIDGEEFLSYSADALLVSTPTGSTAYNLSAGGPVVSPSMQAMILTPVAPHFSLDRSLVLHGDQVVRVQVEQDRSAALVVDGQEVTRLHPGSNVTCRVLKRPLMLVTFEDRGPASLFRSALATTQVR